jgi:transposase
MDLAQADRATLLAAIEAQAAELAELRAQVKALLERESALAAQVRALSAEVTGLRARLGQNSTNSSRPPSSDPPGAHAGEAPPPPVSGKRRPGGQPGHKGVYRALLPPERVNRVLTVLPDRCAGCGAALPSEARPGDPEDERRQVVELPPMAAEVTEYRLAARRCAACGETTRATPPAEARRGGFGVRFTALVTLLTGRYRLSKREAAACVGDLTGVEVSVGTVSALEQQLSGALAPVVAEVATAVQTAPVANLDETGWRLQRGRAWLWVVVTAALTLFHLHRSRGGAVARALLGPGWSGVLGSDRGTMYNWYDRERRQVCWAHLKRDFQKLADFSPTSRPIGKSLLALESKIFAAWHRFRAGELDRGGLQAELAPQQAAMRAVLEEAVAGPDGQAAGVCGTLLQFWPALWTFVTVEGVEPTNNAAERALRPGVLWRKGSFGCHSEDGGRYVERILTLSATCRQQGRPLFDFLVAALDAARQATPPPSLLPSPPA